MATAQENIPALALRYETWQRLVRVTAWILKWSRLRGEPKKGKLSVEELNESEFTWLRNRQRVVFLPEIEELRNKEQVNQNSGIVKLDPHFDQTKKLLVVGGRLQFAQIPEKAKHQVIIPHNDPVIEKLIIHFHFKACHMGPKTTLAILRDRFWLTQRRQEVKRVLGKCLTCNVGRHTLFNRKWHRYQPKEYRWHHHSRTLVWTLQAHCIRKQNEVPSQLRQRPMCVFLSAKILVQFIWNC